MRHKIVIASLMLLIIAGRLAQTQTGSTVLPEFEVASIKPADPSLPAPGRYVSVQVVTTPGRLTAHNANLEELMKGAWSFEDYQITGGPAWMLSARFDVEAKATGAADRDQLLLMLKALLADRFKLAVHRETKELAIYALVVAKGGPKFHALTAEQVACWPACMGSRAPIRFRDLPSLTRYLMRVAADRPVIDKTGLTGNFGLAIDMNRIFAGIEQQGEPTTNQSIYDATVEALPDQLGLKLVPEKASVEILAIDHAEKPGAN